MYKAILNITLALLMLVASNGVVLSKHYCGGRLLGVSVYSVAESCGHKDESSCHKQATKENEDTKGCCDNKMAFLKGIDLETPTLSITQVFPSFDFIILYHVIPALMDNEKEDVRALSTFQPPPLIRYLPVLFQSFLL